MLYSYNLDRYIPTKLYLDMISSIYRSSIYIHFYTTMYLGVC